MKKIKIFALILILLSFLAGVYFYNQFPDKIASHWDSLGQVNGYGSKLQIFLVPVISLAIFLLLIILPLIDPFKKNYKKFQKYYDGFLFLIILFLTYINTLIILFNLNIKFNFLQALIPAFAILIYYTGVFLKHAKRNWFAGIRTPWTLSSDSVWKSTHKLGSKLFKISAIISLTGLIFPNQTIYLLVFPLILSAIFLVIYSYLVFKKEKNL